MNRLHRLTQGLRVRWRPRVFLFLLLLGTPANGFSRRAPAQDSAARQSDTSRPPTLPAEMHFCAAGCSAHKGGTLTLVDGHYVNRPGGGESIYTVEKFTRESVVIYRVDGGRFPGRAIMTGELAPDGNRIIHGEMKWTYHPCCGLSSGTFQLAWGSAIDSVPGSGTVLAKARPSQGNQTNAARTEPPRPDSAQLASPQSASAQPKISPPSKPAEKKSSAQNAAEPPADATKTEAVDHPDALPAIDLNGIWQRPTGNPDLPLQRIQVVVIQNAIEAISLDRITYLPGGMEFFRGTSASANSFKILATGLANAPGANDSRVVQSPQTLQIVDADHFVFAKNVAFTRISTGSTGNVPCDVHNRAHASGDEALARGLLYDYYLKDPHAAVCWYRVAAEQGNAQGELNTATILLDGLSGVAKDPRQGLAWLQKSAMHGNDIADANLAQQFTSGQLLPKSGQRAQYWAARAELDDTRWEHQQMYLPVPSWASDAVGPCDPANPPQVHTEKGSGHFDYKADGRPRKWRGSAEAFAQGRVAYEAHAMELAACWFEVAAKAPVLEPLPTVADVNQRANVYLGVMYAFGLGIKKDPARGFAYMKTAADADDNFGLMYLANFYRYGIGSKLDMHQASALIDRVFKHGGQGMDAFMRVQGTVISDADALRTALDGMQAIATGTTCESEIGSYGITYLKNCVDHAEEFALSHLGPKPAHHTVDTPEEIWPEHFDPVVPPEDRLEKISGMAVDRHGQKVP
jgi:TPR repeat protein